jgi:putative ABC transport system permease protein
MGPSFYLRAMRRESRGARGRTFFFVGCLTVGVSAVVGVSSLVAAFEELIRGQSRELLGADLVVSSPRLLPNDAIAEFVDQMTGETARSDVTRLPTMVSAVGAEGKRRSRLVQAEAVDEHFPLRGHIRLRDGGALADALTGETVVVDADLSALLNVRQGDSLFLGGQSFRVAGVIEEATDRLEFSVAMAPRVLLAHEGLARTSLVAFGSRLYYRALLRFRDDLPPSELGRLAEQLKKELPGASYLRVRAYTGGQPTLRGLERVGQFLGLVALLSLLLGGLGVAQIVRTWIDSRTRSIAVLRCLGMRPREVLVLYLSHVALVAVVSSLLGCVLGSLVPLMVAGYFGDGAERTVLSWWQPGAVMRGLCLGVGIALFFSVPSLTALWKVSPALVFRSTAAPLRPRRRLTAAAAIVLLGGVFLASWSQAGTLDLALGFTVGILLVSLALFATARGLLFLLSRLPRTGLGPYLRYGLAALARPGVGTVGSTVALGLGILVVVTIYLVETRLTAELAGELPVRAPSAYLWDVQPEQEEGVRAVLADAKAEAVNSVPVVMGRIQTIDDTSVAELLQRKREGRGRERRRWPLTREQRLTWLDELPPSNTLVEGTLWSDPERAEVSLERGFAEDLGATVGTRIEFDIQGVPLELVVTSLREVRWRSFDINFFVVVEPGVLDAAPQSRLLGVRLAVQDELQMQDRLSSEFPNVTVLRVRSILEKVTEILSRLAVGVRIVGSFTLVVGFVVLAGAVSATTLRRAREAALLRALGLLRGGVAALIATEYAVLGLASGLMGVAGAYGLAHVFLAQVLELPASLPYALAPWLVGASGLLVGLCGVAASFRVLLVEPLRTLRSN